MGKLHRATAEMVAIDACVDVASWLRCEREGPHLASRGCGANQEVAYRGATAKLTRIVALVKRMVRAAYAGLKCPCPAYWHRRRLQCVERQRPGQLQHLSCR